MKKLWGVKIALFVIAAVALMAFVVMYLWNLLIPDLFHGPIITYWQAIGLMILSRILFRGFHGMKHRGMHYRSWGDWKEKCEKMSPEQRERMRELWKQRCRGFSKPEDASNIDETK